MATEKGHADMNLDKRADIVTKCIDAEDEGGEKRRDADSRRRIAQGPLAGGPLRARLRPYHHPLP